MTAASAAAPGGASGESLGLLLDEILSRPEDDPMKSAGHSAEVAHALLVSCLACELSP